MHDLYHDGKELSVCDIKKQAIVKALICSCPKPTQGIFGDNVNGAALEGIVAECCRCEISERGNVMVQGFQGLSCARINHITENEPQQR